MRAKKFGVWQPPSGRLWRRSPQSSRGSIVRIFLTCIAIWLAFDTWRWTTAASVGEQHEQEWEKELAELEAFSRGAINARAGGDEDGDDWFESWRERREASTQTRPITDRWWLGSSGSSAAIDRSEGPLVELGNFDDSSQLNSEADRVGVLRARVQRARERERALFLKIRLARKARLEDLRRERYHQSAEYKRWLKVKEEHKQTLIREKEAQRQAAPFQYAPWRMHDGKFHDLDDMPVVRSTRLAVAMDAVGSGASLDRDEDVVGQGENGADRDNVDEGAAGQGSAHRGNAVSQGRQHDAYLRRGGAAQGWASVSPIHSSSLATSSSDGDERLDTDNSPHTTSTSSKSASMDSYSKRWVALRKQKRSSSKKEIDAQTLEAQLVYGDGMDVKGAGLDIEGIDEGESHDGRKSHTNGAGKPTPADVAKQQFIVSGGGSKDLRLGGDRWGVWVVGRNKRSQEGTSTRVGGSNSMMRGHSSDVVKVGGTFHKDGGRNKFVYQNGFGFANLHAPLNFI